MTKNGFLLTVAHNLTEDGKPNGKLLPWIWVCCFDPVVRDWTDIHRAEVDRRFIDPKLDAAGLKISVKVSAPLCLATDWQKEDSIAILGFQPEDGRTSGFNVRFLMCHIPRNWEVAPFDLREDPEPSLRLGMIDRGYQPLGRGISGGPVLNCECEGYPTIAIEKAQEYPPPDEQRPPEIKATAVNWLRGILNKLPEARQIVWLRRSYRGSERARSLRASYLSQLYEATERLSLGGIDPKAASDSEAFLNLDTVYTALLTLMPQDKENPSQDENREHERRRLSAQEQLNRHRRLVVLGDPGSGKTTFVNFVAMCLAGESLGDRQANMTLLTAPLPDEIGQDQDERQPWEYGPVLPLRIILRDFAARGLPPTGIRASGKHLWDFIVKTLEESSIGDYATHMRQELLEQGGLIMLDGLDEVSEADQRREQIKEAVKDFSALFPRCRMLITSRTYAYQKENWRLSGFTETVLAPFSAGQVRRFVDHWYADLAIQRGLAPDKAKGDAESLKRVIFSSDRLQALAERPLLLTLMASLHAWRGGSLPEKREKLYNDAVDLLLDWWEQRKIIRDVKGNLVEMQPSLVEWLKVDREKVLNLVNELSFHAHEKQADPVGSAEILADDLVIGLVRVSKNPDVRPDRVVEYLRDRAGLLLARSERVYTFPHRTFQEYLAACYLTDHEYPEQVANLARTQPERWREVALLAGAKAKRGTDFAVWAFARELCVNAPNEIEYCSEEIWGAHLAGLLLVESARLDRVSESNRRPLDRIQKWLVRILEKNMLPAVERVAAGNSLARLGDPRFRADSWYLPAEDLLGFVKIPAGSFVMGSDDKKDSLASRDEMPQHEVSLPAYYIGRYPVTVAQYRAFVEDSEYRPGDEESLKGENNHPAIYVGWRDVLAYCKWLNERLRAWGKTPEPLATLLRERKDGDYTWRISLPSEAEWEKAARGTDGRIFPWGDEPDANWANCDATGIGTTSPTGCFSGGASQYGCLDMSGNAWEWTRTLSDSEYPYIAGDGRERLEEGEARRVLRGGAFDFNQFHVRCSNRWRDPDSRNVSLGFRLVISRIFHASAP